MTVFDPEIKFEPVHCNVHRRKKRVVKPRFCKTGKASFVSHKAAMTRAGRIKNRHKHWHAYLCAHCKQYHLSSTQPYGQRPRPGTVSRIPSLQSA